MAQIDPSVRVLIADAHSLFREALVSALAGQSDLEVVGEAKDGLEAVSEASRTEPEVALLEADLPNCDGVRLTDLIDAIRAVHRGDTLIPARMLGDLLGRLIDRRQQQSDAVRRIGRLTTREREVLNLLAQGGDNDTIAQALVISPQTARTHIQNVLVKLGVHSRLEAAALAIRNGPRDTAVP